MPYYGIEISIFSRHFLNAICSEVLVDIKCCCFINRSLLISQMISTLGVTEKDMKSTLKLNALNNACK